MLAQIPPEPTFILSIWLESVLYGCYFNLFCASVYIVRQRKSYRTVPSRVMLVTMIIMFVLATMHIVMNLFRLLRGFVWLRDDPGGPAAYYGDLARWDNVFKDTIYGTQIIIGDGLAIYRCWLVWNNNFYVIALPLVLLIGSTVSGYITCWLFTQVASGTVVFDPRLQKSITAFYSLAVAQNLMTTGMIAFQIWRHERAVTAVLHTSDRSSFFPIIRILVESAALYVAAELVLLVLYTLNLNAQFIILEILTPTAGIVFTSITVRLSLRSSKSANVTSAQTAGTENPTFTLPMTQLAVRVTRNVHNDSEDGEIKGSDDGQSFTAKGDCNDSPSAA